MQAHLCQELNCQHKCWRAHKEEICPASEWASFSQCIFLSNSSFEQHLPSLLLQQQKPTQLPLALSPWISFISHQNSASPHWLTPCWLQTTGREVAAGDRAEQEPRAMAGFCQPALPSWRRPAMRQEPGKSKGSVLPKNAQLVPVCVSAHACCAC